MRVGPYTFASLVLLALSAVPTLANTHSDPARCPFCQMSVLKDTATTDYQVNLSSNGKTTSYRCVLCALADAKVRKGDLLIQAASEVKGHPVKISRTGDKWTITPDSAVFVYAEGDHDQCQTRYRALTSADAFKSYVQSDPKVLRNAKQLSLSQMLKVSG